VPHDALSHSERNEEPLAGVLALADREQVGRDPARHLRQLYLNVLLKQADRSELDVDVNLPTENSAKAVLLREDDAALTSLLRSGC
jgi:hypothetical protein